MRGKRVSRPCALVRIDQAVRAPRHRDHLSRELHRRGGARHAGGQQGQDLRRARHRHPGRHARRTPAPWGITARQGDRAWATSSRSRPPSSRCRRCTSAASACCPAATTASPGRRMARTPSDLEYFVKYLGMTPMEAIAVGDQAWRRDHDAGPTSSARSSDGYLADLLLVDGDPLGQPRASCGPEAASSRS